MTTWIALLRGINVGGNNILPMKDLRALLQRLGCDRARTYIQSGNCVFESEDADALRLSEKIADAILSEFGFKPSVLILEETAFRRAIDANPYPQGAEDPKSVHFFFLAEPASHVDIEALDKVKTPNERYSITDDVFYLFAPDGIGRSKLASQVEKKLGVAATARNLRSVGKILDLTAKSP